MKTCWYCFKDTTNGHSHVIKIPNTSQVVVVCDYCLSKLANSYFNHAINANIPYAEKKKVFLITLRLAKAVHNKQNLCEQLQTLTTLNYSTIYYYLVNGLFEKLLAKISKP
ncbi:MAG: hypothetical protein QXP96_04950 [Thermoproteota archaeon]